MAEFYARQRRRFDSLKISNNELCIRLEESACFSRNKAENALYRIEIDFLSHVGFESSPPSGIEYIYIHTYDVVSREASNKLLAGTDRRDATVFPNLRTWISISRATLVAAGTR